MQGRCSPNAVRRQVGTMKSKRHSFLIVASCLAITYPAKVQVEIGSGLGLTLKESQAVAEPGGNGNGGNGNNGNNGGGKGNNGSQGNPGNSQENPGNSGNAGNSGSAEGKGN